jgi:nucleoside-diphosphate-sugar epimerase
MRANQGKAILTVGKTPEFCVAGRAGILQRNVARPSLHGKRCDNPRGVFPAENYATTRRSAAASGGRVDDVKVLVTGGSGFVGSVLCETLARAGHQVRAVVREGKALPRGAGTRTWPGEFDADTRWEAALQDIDAVAHLAARAHVLNDPPESRGLYFKLNAEGTRALALAAARAGVRRFVYLSTVKVNGERTGDRPFGPADMPHPEDHYGESKWLGEQHLAAAAAAGGFDAFTIRSPLVYGPGVRANFLRLMDWVSRGLPLPFASIENARSMVSVSNLCDLIERCLTCPARGTHTLMVSDGVDLSTPGLVRLLGEALGRPARLLPVPPALLRLLGRATGRAAEVERLCSSLRVDIAETRRLLDWAPALSVEQGLASTANWYLSREVRQ